MDDRRDVLHYILRHDIINLNEARFQVIIGGGLDDGGFN